MLVIVIDIISHRLIHNRRNRHLHDVIDNYRPLFTEIDIQQVKYTLTRCYDYYRHLFIDIQQK